MGLEKYKYLVTIGCSQTYGSGCKLEDTWSYKLSKELGLEEINLSCNGAGWYYIQNTLNSFINSNRDKLSECFVILQQSTLERRMNYDELPLVHSDYFKEYGINFISPVGGAALPFKDWEKYRHDYQVHEIEKDLECIDENGRLSGQWIDMRRLNTNLTFFPEHRHYPNWNHNWKLGDDYDIEPPYIHQQLNELMLHWGSQMNSYHLYLKSLGIDHIMVDGYSPFLSYKLDFKNYYDTDEEFNWVKEFWSTSTENEKDPNDVMLYDFKKINCGWVFDSINSKYKIDDVILWSLYQFKTHGTDWNIDGGHAGKLGMDLIKDVIKQNLQEKGWV
jgi:hypothetical protein